MNLFHNIIKSKINLCLFCFFIVTSKVDAMNFGKKICTFSAIIGTVTDGDKAISGAKVKRRYTWDGKDIYDTQTTDSNGDFSFPNAFERSLWVLYPHNPSIGQMLTIHVDNKEYQAWGFVK